MREEILSAVQQMVAAITGATVVIGSLPPLEGYAVSIAGGAPMGTFWPLTSNEELPIQFTGKSADQQQLAATMGTVHKALTTAPVGALPSASGCSIRYPNRVRPVSDRAGAKRQLNLWLDFSGQILCEVKPWTISCLSRMRFRQKSTPPPTGHSVPG